VKNGAKLAGVEKFFEFSLLGLLASGYLAVVGSGYVDTPSAVLVALGLVTRTLMVAGWIRFDPPPWLINALTAAYIVFYLADYLYISREFLPATVHLVFFLAVAKLVTARTHRDYLYVKIIAFLELLAASILSGDANYFLFLALFLMFGAATFASGEIVYSAGKAGTIVRSGRRHIGWRLGVLTAATVAGILVLTTGLFVVLPRTARAAFQRLVPERYHLPGFSGEVRLGEIGELKMRNTAVMHVKILEPIAPQGLKWRGSALSRFDGKRWFNDSRTAETLTVDRGVLSLVPVADRLRPGPRISYEVSMQEIASDVLFFAGVPETLRIGVPLVIRTPTDGYRLGFTPDHLRYSAYCLLERAGHPHYRGEDLSQAARSLNLELPPLDGRIRELASTLARGEVSDYSRARKLETYLRRQYSYTIELPAEAAADPIADFLFQRRKGHCEYFASSLAVMLRSIGIPARVATGFQSGVYNPLSGWYLIRASDAHSWVEGWLSGYGWVTLDPTPPDTNSPGESLSTRFQLYLDAAQVFWQDWVLGYDFERQITLAERVGESSRRFQVRWMEGAFDRFADRLKSRARALKQHGWKAAVALAVVAVILLSAPAAWRRWKALARVRRVRRGEVSVSDATLLYERMLEILRQRGMEKPAWVTPNEFASKLGPSAGLVADFTAAYNELRFGEKKAAAGTMVALLEKLERGAPSGAK
jgi:transglutaminase-like putative cysteine protease